MHLLPENRVLINVENYRCTYFIYLMAHAPKSTITIVHRPVFWLGVVTLLGVSSVELNDIYRHLVFRKDIQCHEKHLILLTNADHQISTEIAGLSIWGMPLWPSYSDMGEAIWVRMHTHHPRGQFVNWYWSQAVELLSVSHLLISNPLTLANDYNCTGHELFHTRAQTWCHLINEYDLDAADLESR